MNYGDKRVILHSDMNNFYASVEIKLNPELKGIPIVVAGSEDDRHGVVLAKSKEAKIMGVKTAETVWEAKQKCPNLKVVPPHHEEYAKYSALAQEIYCEYTNQVEPLGLDECWLDVTGSQSLFGSGADIADAIRRRIKDELGLTVSIGVSFNKIFAKLGSDLQRPDEISVITESNFREKVWPLRADALMGVGKVTMDKLKNIGIKTIGDLASAEPALLKARLGRSGIKLWQYANGEDFSEVADYVNGKDRKSISSGETCREDLHSTGEVHKLLRKLSVNVSKRLQEKNMKAGGIQISFRDSDLNTFQYQCRLFVPTISSMVISKVAEKLFDERYDWRKNIRSVSVKAINLSRNEKGVQLSLFNKSHEEDFIQFDEGIEIESLSEKAEEIEKLLFDIKQKFGDDSVKFGHLIEERKKGRDKKK